MMTFKNFGSNINIYGGAGSFVFGKQTFKVNTPVEFNLNTIGEVISYKIESAGSVENEVGNVSILESTGNDTIDYSASNVTINGLGGNDVIVGFNASDKLIIDDTYSTVKGDNDELLRQRYYHTQGVCKSFFD